MPPIAEMLETERFASAPPNPRVILNDVQNANGFSYGEADINFFNGVIGRLSDLVYKNQEDIKNQLVQPVDIASGADSKLLYRNFFNGTEGTDALNMTSVKGAGLENEAGTGLNKYYCTGNSTLAAATNLDYPLYADCGQDAKNMRATSVLLLKLGALSSDGDFFAMSFNCIGRYERTDVGFEVSGNKTTLTPFLRRYDTAGLLVNEVIKDTIDINLFINRASMVRVKDKFQDNKIQFFMPFYNIVVEFAEDLDQGTLSNKHGFTFSPQTFELASLTLNLINILDEAKEA